MADNKEKMGVAEDGLFMPFLKIVVSILSVATIISCLIGYGVSLGVEAVIRRCSQ